MPPRQSAPEFSRAHGAWMIALAFAAYRSGRSARSGAAGAATVPANTVRENTVESIMMTDVYALSEDHTALEALQIFTERGISGAPVLHSDGSLAGFLSDGDVMRYLSAAHPSSASIYSWAVEADDDLEQAMAELAELNVLTLASREVLTVDAGSSIPDAVAALSDARIKKVPVVDGENRFVVGIVSRSAINRLAVGSYLRSRLESPELVGAAVG